MVRFSEEIYGWWLFATPQLQNIIVRLYDCSGVQTYLGLGLLLGLVLGLSLGFRLYSGIFDKTDIRCLHALVR